LLSLSLLACQRDNDQLTTDAAVVDGMPDLALSGPDFASSLTCPTGKGDCDGNPGNGCETDLTSDNANCGQCGYSCGAGTCATSACVLAQPGSITYTFGDFECITTDGTNVYFMASSVNGAAGSDILYVPTSGGAITQLPGATGMRGAGLVEYGNFIYWADYAAGKIMETPKAGQTGATRTVVQGLTNPLRVAVDANNVYYTSKNGTGAAQKASGTSMWSTIQPGGAPWGLTVDATNAYYTDRMNGAVVQVDIGTGTPTVIVPNQAGARGLFGDATTLYWTTSSGNVMMSAKAAINPMLIVQGQSNPQELTVDVGAAQSEVYWADVGPMGNVSKAPAVSSSAATVLAPNQASAQCVAVDATSVYWAVYGGTQILKAAK
jgi:hypothetical protein